MEIIKGLLLKDLFVFKTYLKHIIFTVIVFMIVIFLASVSQDMILTGTILFLIVFGMNSLSTFSYDENSDIDKYLLSLPISRKEVVMAKYLFSFLDSFLSFVVGFLLSVIITFLVKHNISNLGNTFTNAIMIFTGISYLLCLNIPCIYKWGMEKGRMQAAVIPIFFIFFLGIIIVSLVLIFPVLLSDTFLDKLSSLTLVICILLNVMFYVISYMVSYKIFKEKDL